MLKYVLSLCILLGLNSVVLAEEKNNDTDEKSKKPANGVFLSMALPSVFNDLSLSSDGPTIGIPVRLGYRIGKVQPFLQISYASNSSITDDNSKTEEINSRLNIGLGLKYLLKSPKKGVLPYVVGSFATAVVGETKGGEDALKDVETSRWMFNGAFGAQYSFSKKFSIAAELGLLYSNYSMTPKGGKETANSILGLSNQIILEYVF